MVMQDGCKKKNRVLLYDEMPYVYVCMHGKEREQNEQTRLV